MKLLLLLIFLFIPTYASSESEPSDLEKPQTLNQLAKEELENGLISGPPNDLADENLIDLTPNSEHLDDEIDYQSWIFLTRLTGALSLKSTVSEVNKVLIDTGARIIDSRKGKTIVVLSVPKQKDVAALEKFASELEASKVFILVGTEAAGTVH